jgi:hypothetical protein
MIDGTTLPSKSWRQTSKPAVGFDREAKDEAAGESPTGKLSSNGFAEMISQSAQMHIKGGLSRMETLSTIRPWECP